MSSIVLDNLAESNFEEYTVTASNDEIPRSSARSSTSVLDEYLTGFSNVECTATEAILMNRSINETESKTTGETTNEADTNTTNVINQHQSNRVIKRNKPKPCKINQCKRRKSEIELEEQAEFLRGITAKVEPKFDPCVGMNQKPYNRELKETIFSRIANERYKVRRIQRKKAKPTPSKGDVKTTKTAQMRLKYMRNEKVIPSVTEAHMKKYKKPPFKTIGVLRMCFEKLSETLEKLKKKSPSKKKVKK